MSEAEWRKLGVQQSRGWVHYMVHKPGEGMYLIMQSYKPFGYMYINPVTGFPSSQSHMSCSSEGPDQQPAGTSNQTANEHNIRDSQNKL